MVDLTDDDFTKAMFDMGSYSPDGATSGVPSVFAFGEAFKAWPQVVVSVNPSNATKLGQDQLSVADHDAGKRSMTSAQQPTHDDEYASMHAFFAADDGDDAEPTLDAQLFDSPTFCGSDTPVDIADPFLSEALTQPPTQPDIQPTQPAQSACTYPPDATPTTQQMPGPIPAWPMELLAAMEVSSQETSAPPPAPSIAKRPSLPTNSANVAAISKFMEIIRARPLSAATAASGKPLVPAAAAKSGPAATAGTGKPKAPVGVRKAAHSADGRRKAAHSATSATVSSGNTVQSAAALPAGPPVPPCPPGGHIISPFLALSNASLMAAPGLGWPHHGGQPKGCGAGHVDWASAVTHSQQQPAASQQHQSALTAEVAGAGAPTRSDSGCADSVPRFQLAPAACWLSVPRGVGTGAASGDLYPAAIRRSAAPTLPYPLSASEFAPGCHFPRAFTMPPPGSQHPQRAQFPGGAPGHDPACFPFAGGPPGVPSQAFLNRGGSWSPYRARPAPYHMRMDQAGAFFGGKGGAPPMSRAASMGQPGRAWRPAGAKRSNLFKDEGVLAAEGCYRVFNKEPCVVLLPRSMQTALSDDFLHMHQAYTARKAQRRMQAAAMAQGVDESSRGSVSSGPCASSPTTSMARQSCASHHLPTQRTHSCNTTLPHQPSPLKSCSTASAADALPAERTACAASYGQPAAVGPVADAATPAVFCDSTLASVHSPGSHVVPPLAVTLPVGVEQDNALVPSPPTMPPTPSPSGAQAVREDVPCPSQAMPPPPPRAASNSPTKSSCGTAMVQGATAVAPACGGTTTALLCPPAARQQSAPDAWWPLNTALLAHGATAAPPLKRTLTADAVASPHSATAMMQCLAVCH